MPKAKVDSADAGTSPARPEVTAPSKPLAERIRDVEEELADALEWPQTSVIRDIEAQLAPLRAIASELEEKAEDLHGRRDAYDPTRREMCMSGTELRLVADSLARRKD
jgi:hypothetical protein